MIRVWELINMSDYTTFEADDEIAVMITFELGGGQYAGEPLDGNDEGKVPIFLFGGANEWLKEKHGREYKEFGAHLIATRLPDVIAAFESVWYAKPSERQLIKDATAAMDSATRRKYIADYNNKKRSGLNNICGRAASIVEHFEKANV